MVGGKLQSSFATTISQHRSSQNLSTISGLLEVEMNKESPTNKSVTALPLEKMNIQFTCNVCGTRNNKYFTRTAYEHGLVIIRCDGCGNQHVIADNLGWIKRMEGKKNIEEILAAKGIKIRGSVISSDKIKFTKPKNQSQLEP